MMTSSAICIYVAYYIGLYWKNPVDESLRMDHCGLNESTNVLYLVLDSQTYHLIITYFCLWQQHNKS